MKLVRQQAVTHQPYQDKLDGEEPSSSSDAQPNEGIYSTSSVLRMTH